MGGNFGSIRGMVNNLACIGSLYVLHTTQWYQFQAKYVCMYMQIANST